MVSGKKIFFNVFPNISLCKQCDPWRGLFWPQGHNLNKLCRGPLSDATYTKYQGSMPYGFRQEDFAMFFPIYKAYVKYVTPGGAIFGHRGIICTNLVEVHQVMIQIVVFFYPEVQR